MESCELQNSKWAIALVAVLLVSIFAVAAFGMDKEYFLPVAEDMLSAVLSMAVIFLNILGGTLIIFGSILVGARYILKKIKTPCKPFGAAPRVTFLTLGLEIFIGAEIINTATTRTMDGFVLLSLTIATRGLIGLILILEKRWGSLEEEHSNGTGDKSKDKEETS